MIPIPVLQLGPADFLDILNAIVQSNIYYIAIFVIFAWVGFDKYFRKKYVLHIVQEEGNNLVEVKQFSKPLSWANKWIEWKINRGWGKKATLRDYKLDPKNVVFTDRYNKRHIINSAQNAFNFHPYSDTPDKIDFVTIAEISAEDLADTISKNGFLARVETFGKTLGGMSNTTLMFIGLIGIVFGIAIVSVYPSPFGLAHVISAVNTVTNSTTTATVTTQIGSVVTQVP